MAITYENVIFDRVIDSLHSLLADEFSVPILFDETDERSNQSFLIRPVSDSLLELLANGQSRQYEIEINYELRLSGNYTKNSYKQLTEIAERMKRLMHNNSSYSPSGSYKWHEGRIQSTSFERDEEDPTVSNVTMQFNCTSTEVL
jgi:hypothetical protein